MAAAMIVVRLRIRPPTIEIISFTLVLAVKLSGGVFASVVVLAVVVAVTDNLKIAAAGDVDESVNLGEDTVGAEVVKTKALTVAGLVAWG
jgi:hypothetical protein